MTLIELTQKQKQLQKQNGNQNQSLRAIIQGFHGDSVVVERLKEMGLHQGLEIQSVGGAPFGGPLLFRFGNTVLALRQEEAQCTQIQIL